MSELLKPKVTVVTDSCADLPEDVRTRLGIRQLPAYFIIDGNNF